MPQIIIIIAIVLLDQFTKHLTDLYLMPLGTSVPLIDGVFHLTSAHNTGAAFSMFAGSRILLLVVAAFAAAAMLYILFRYRKKLYALTRFALALVIGGALGNIIDRALFGYVRDMLEARFINFAIFNIADCGVTVGAILLAFDMLFGKGKLYFEEKPKAQAGLQDLKTPENPCPTPNSKEK